MISAVDNNGQEELTSVYVAVHYAILYQRLAQRQGIQQSTLFYFQAFFQWHIRCTWSIVELLFLNSNWRVGIRSSYLIIGLRRLSINFSNNLDIIGNNEIGRYDSISLRFLPGFGIIIMSAIFHTSGTCFSQIQALNNVLHFHFSFRLLCGLSIMLIHV
jgi:hypothetical protein